MKGNDLYANLVIALLIEKSKLRGRVSKNKKKVIVFKNIISTSAIGKRD